jgi:hypothetical protein
MTRLPPPLPEIRQVLKAALAATPLDRCALRHGLSHAIKAIEREAVDRNDKK